METNGYEFEISRHIRKAARMIWTHIGKAWNSREDEEQIMLELYLAICAAEETQGHLENYMAVGIMDSAVAGIFMEKCEQIIHWLEKIHENPLLWVLAF